MPARIVRQAVAVQVIDAQDRSALFLSRLKEKLREFFCHWKLPMAPKPCDVNTPAAVVRFQDLQPTAFSLSPYGRWLRATATLLPSGARKTLVDVHGVQHIFHAAAAVGNQGDRDGIAAKAGLFFKPACSG